MNEITPKGNEIKDDPDYEDFHHRTSVDPSNARVEDSKISTVSKIHNIVEKQFVMELELKEKEINKIERRIHQTKVSLDRLRAYVVASYFGSGGKVIPCAKIQEKSHAKRPKLDEQNDAITSNMSLEELQKQDLSKFDNLNKDSEQSSKSTNQEQETKSGNRFYTSKKVIVGNVSKYLVADVRKENDKSTHKWMVYVRTDSDDETDISKYVKCVQFFLHPSYIPNDIVTVNKPPYQVTRRGWGEFPVRVQLHFKDARNKRFDVIHHLKLDKTYTGLQTLGAETIVNLELHRHSNLPSDGAQDISPAVDKHTDFQIEIDRPPQPETPNEASIEEANEDENSQKHTLLTLPIIADLRSKLPSHECASVASSCVSSAAPSRSNSPVMEEPVNCILNDPELEGLLYQLVDEVPLICDLKDKCSHHFTCPSLNVYESWHFTKRRASEWQRALFLKNLLIENITEQSKNLKCPSTKEIMVWLRVSGLTPCERGLKLFTENDFMNYCELCGGLLKSSSLATCLYCENRKIDFAVVESSLSPYTSVLSNIKIKEETLQSIAKVNTQRQCETDGEIVDIVYSPIKDGNNESKQSVYCCKDAILPTELENWITDLVQGLGINLQPIVLSNTKAYVVNAMLLEATKQFLSHLLRKSNAEAKKEHRSLEPVMVTFNHVVETLNNVPLFDFLTDAHLGKL